MIHHVKIFFYSFAMNLCYNGWILAAVGRNAFIAALLDGCIVFFSALAVLEYVKYKRLIPAAVLGAMTSTWLVVRFWV